MSQSKSNNTGRFQIGELLFPMAPPGSVVAVKGIDRDLLASGHPVVGGKVMLRRTDTLRATDANSGAFICSAIFMTSK